MRIAFALVAVLITAPFPRALSAQGSDSVSFAPGVKVSRQQASAIDSLVLAYRDEGRALLARGDSTSRSAEARRQLRLTYQSAIAALLDPAQRAAYDAWFTRVEPGFAERQRTASSVP